MSTSLSHAECFDRIPDCSGRIADLLKRSEAEEAFVFCGFDALEAEYGQSVYTEALYQLTRLELPAPQAKSSWRGILAHQRNMAQTLGRPVGLLTAVCDYFHHVRPMFKEPVLVEVRLLLTQEERAYRDELTGLYNRRYFNQEISREVERSRRFGHCFALLMLDVDHFKRFNDTFGHPAGDQVLRDLAQVLKQTSRLSDWTARYGGEEFVVILPQSCREEAAVAAERIREAVERHEVVFQGKNLGHVTVSIGVATFPGDALAPGRLVERADKAMYLAKRQRNKVAVFTDIKRRHPRYAVDSPVYFRLSGQDRTLWPGRTRDVSFGGMLCVTDRQGTLGSTLELMIYDSQARVELPLIAKVRRVTMGKDNRVHMGLSFELTTPEEQKALLALLSARAGTFH